MPCSKLPGKLQEWPTSCVKFPPRRTPTPHKLGVGRPVVIAFRALERLKAMVAPKSEWGRVTLGSPYPGGFRSNSAKVTLVGGCGGSTRGVDDVLVIDELEQRWVIIMSLSKLFDARVLPRAAK